MARVIVGYKEDSKTFTNIHVLLTLIRNCG